jgi:uncharacterized protein YwqG
MDKEQAVDQIRGSHLAQHADILLKYLLPSARLIVQEAPEIADEDRTTSHLGGLPSLPRGAAWPVWDKRDYLNGQIAHWEAQFRANPRATGLRDVVSRMRQELLRGPVPLLFLAQLSLREIHAAAPLPGWPSEGTLLFFYEPSGWGFDPRERGHHRILFFGPQEELASVPFPQHLPEEARFPQRKVGFVREWTLPHRIKSDSLDLSFWGNEDYQELCQQLMGVSSEKEPIHRCGGHPQEIQGEMRLECQLVTNDICCGDSSGYSDPRRAILESGAADWDLVLQVDSDDEMGWMWGDVGRIYFWARRQDIEAAHFDASWGVLQCY